MKNKGKWKIKLLLFLMLSFPYMLTSQQVMYMQELKKELTNY